MKKFLKILVVAVSWFLFIAVLLEAILRLTADVLPPRLAVGARSVMEGEPLTYDHLTTVSQYDIDHYVVLKPNLDLHMTASADVRFHVVTEPLWEGTIGFRTRPVDYFVDAVVVGDSFAFCFTDYADCWVSQLETATGLGLVNLAQPGTGSMSHWRVLDTYARPMRPQIVLWQFFGNDFYEDYQLAVWREEVDRIAIEQPPQPAYENTNEILAWFRRHSVAFALVEIVFFGESAYIADSEQAFIGEYSIEYRDGELHIGQPYELEVLDVDDPRVQVGLPYTRQALARAQEAVAGWGGRIAIMIVPTREEVYAHLAALVMGQDALETLASARFELLALCEELDLLCYDPLADLRQYAQNGEHLYYTDDLHLNPRGNAVFAALVADWLDGQGLLTEQ